LCFDSYINNLRRTSKIAKLLLFLQPNCL